MRVVTLMRSLFAGYLMWRTVRQRRRVARQQSQRRRVEAAASDKDVFDSSTTDAGVSDVESGLPGLKAWDSWLVCNNRPGIALEWHTPVKAHLQQYMARGGFPAQWAAASSSHAAAAKPSPTCCVLG